MAGMKEIRVKIKSVQNTRKITKAMEMVAASKMRRAQERMKKARPYAEKLRNITSNLARANPEYRPAYLQDRAEVKNVGMIVITTDKGLCGGLNTNILRAVLLEQKKLSTAGQGILVTTVGSKGLQIFSRLGGVLSQAVQLGDNPSLTQLLGPINAMVTAFLEGKVDKVMLCYSRFVNTMKQDPVIEQVLPLPHEALHAGNEQKYGWDYLYEPDPVAVIDDLLKRYLETLVYQAVMENAASEQSARMVAMKAASDNAKKVIEELQLVYNKTRQAAITKEISEIVGGAAAV